jgi:hypothetical protein
LFLHLISFIDVGRGQPVVAFVYKLKKTLVSLATTTAITTISTGTVAASILLPLPIDLLSIILDYCSGDVLVPLFCVTKYGIYMLPSPLQLLLQLKLMNATSSHETLATKAYHIAWFSHAALSSSDTAISSAHILRGYYPTTGPFTQTSTNEGFDLTLPIMGNHWL